MFDSIAARYDLTNEVLALGQTRVWRRAVARAVAPRPGQRVLDVAAGTGSSTVPLAAAGADVVVCDFSFGMLRTGQRRHPELPFTAADATRLPFREASFDAVTISFGLRNVAERAVALREMLRVTKPGGRLVVCEFSTPTWAPFRIVYQEYLMRALPRLATAVTSRMRPYEYLAESIRAWPDQPGLAAELRSAGWQRPAWRDLTGGVVALHRGWRAET